MSKSSDGFKEHELCKTCKYECKVIYSANLQMCRAIKEDDEVAKRAKELSKAYEKRRASR